MRLINANITEIHRTKNLIERVSGLSNFALSREVQDPIRLFEDSLANRADVFFRVYPEDLQRMEIRRYLLLTSLPFVIEPIKASDSEIGYRIQELWRAGLTRCKKCPKVVTRLTMPTGNLYPKVMMIAEAPGVGDGEKTNFDRVLVYGNTSYLLRQALHKIKIYQHSWFTNLLKCSLPGNREGTLEEYKHCLPYLETEGRILGPKMVVLFGSKVQNFFKTLGFKGKNRTVVDDTTGIFGNAKVASLPHPSSYNYRGKPEELIKDLKDILGDLE